MMDSITQENIKEYIEPHFHTNLRKESYEVVSKKALDLLTHTRFDLAFKLFYLDMRDKHRTLAESYYTEHIRALSLGKFTEPGNEKKDSLEKFIQSFDSTFRSMKENGFDASQTLIPLSKNKFIANGAHRVASAIFLGKDVSCVEIDTENHRYDYKFFYQRNVPITLLDAAATTFVAYAEGVHVAFVWPIASCDTSQIETLIPNIIYHKEFTLTPNGAHNLLSQIYAGEAWLGSESNDFSGSKGKLIECFKSFDPVHVVAFQSDDLDEVLTLKEKIRSTFNVGKHSIHITDTKEEAIRTSQTVFNENAIHFLNHAKPNRYLDTHKKIDLFKDFLVANTRQSDMCVIDSSMILSLYGLREAKDIDYLMMDTSNIEIEYENIHPHDEILQYYSSSKKDLIYDPQNYFYFKGLKFIAFTQVYQMKQNRAEVKDKNDCKLMESLIDNDKLQAFWYGLKQRVFYLQVLVKQKIIQFLHTIHLFDAVYAGYKKLKDFRA